MGNSRISSRTKRKTQPNRQPNHQSDDKLLKLAGGIAILHLYQKIRDIEGRQSIQEKYPKCYDQYINFDECQSDFQNDIQVKCQESWKEFVECYKQHQYEE